MRFGVIVVWCCLCLHPASARADIFTDIYEGVTRVTGLRGIVKGLAGGASEGVRGQLNRFVDEKIDPLIGRISQIVDEKIDTAALRARELVQETERALLTVIAQARLQMEGLTRVFFERLDKTLNLALTRVEALLDKAICEVMPGKRIPVDLGPFGGGNSITVKWPARTHCYKRYLTTQGDPPEETFVNWEFFDGELCEYELRINNISPKDSDSIERVRKGYEKLSEMAKSAQCAAPDADAKIEMMRKLITFQKRAQFFRRLEKRGVSR